MGSGYTVPSTGYGKAAQPLVLFANAAFLLKNFYCYDLEEIPNKLSLLRLKTEHELCCYFQAFKSCITRLRG